MIPPKIPDCEADRIRALHRYEVLDTPADPAFDDLTKLAAHVLETPIALISLVDSERQWFKSRYGLDAAETPRDVSFCGHVVVDERMLVVPDASADERFVDNPFVTGKPHVRFYAGVPLCTADGYVLGTMCAIDHEPREVSERQLDLLQVLARRTIDMLELRLQASRARNYRELLENYHGLATIAGFDGFFKQLNPAWKELLGYSEPELLAVPFLEFVHPDDRAATAHVIADLAGEKKVSSFDNRFRCKGGAYRWLRWSASADVERQRMYASAIDVTERRAAEQEAHNNAARLRAVFDNVVDGLITIDERGSILSFNPAACRIFLYETEEVLGKNISMLMPEPYHSQHDGYLSRYAATRERRVIGVGREVVGRRRDGALFPLDLAVSEIEIEGGRIFSGIVRDISERKEVERMKNEFVSTVSHELRTPLTSIRGSLRLIEGGMAGVLPDQAMELVRVAGRNTDRLVRLINDILDVEKMEAGHLELDMESLSGSALVQHTIESLAGMAKQTGVTLCCRADADVSVRGDHDRIIQVLTNLVSNAMKFSPRDGQVEVSIEKVAGTGVRFSVRDWGDGIAPEQLEKLFRKFQQLDSSDERSKGGSGLGLVISKRIVEQHGGRIGVESVVGEGSTFWFELEGEEGACRTSRIPPPPSVPLRRSSERGADGDRPVVLVVEGDEGLARLLSLNIERQGYMPIVANSILTAEETLGEGGADAVLLDLTLPDGDGLRLLERISSGEFYDRVPVVVLAGRTAHQAGYGKPLLVDWLSKPVDESQLRAALAVATKREQRPTVLVVEDDPSARQVIVALLGELGVSCLEADNGATAVELACIHKPDLLVLDVGIPVADGFSVVDALRDAGQEAMPVVVYTGRDLSRAEREQLKLGITRHLTKSRTSEGEFLEVVGGMLKQATGAVGR